MRAVAGPVSGLVAQMLLLAALAGTVGLGPAGLGRRARLRPVPRRGAGTQPAPRQVERLGPAGWVTLARATLAVGVAALTADSFDREAPVATLVALSAVALVLDFVDGQVARRTGTASRLGARLDGEVDAFLILVLACMSPRSAGGWVLAIGAARYAFLAAGGPLAWMRAALPPRDWRRVVAATQGITLTVAAADVLPPALTQAALAVRCPARRVVRPRRLWLWRRRHAADRRPAATAGRGRVRAGISAALTVFALLLVWAALVAPNEPSRLTPGAFLRLPLEGVVVVALAARPARPRPPPAGMGGGPALGLLVREAPRRRLLHRLRPAVRPCRRLELRRHRRRDAARLDRPDQANLAVAGVALAASPRSSSRRWRCSA